MPSRVKAACKGRWARPHGNRGVEAPSAVSNSLHDARRDPGWGMTRRRGVVGTVLLSCVRSAGGVPVGAFDAARVRRFAGRERIRMTRPCEATGPIPAPAICFRVHKPLATHRREMARPMARLKEPYPPTSTVLWATPSHGKAD